VTFTGCKKEEETTKLVTLPVSTESFAESGKTYIDNSCQTRWSANDVVFINGKEKKISTDGDDFKLTDLTLSETGYTAFYPTNIATEQTTATSGGINHIQLSATQEYVTDNEGRQVVRPIMAAHLATPTGTLAFANMCVALKLNLTNNCSAALRISSISISDDLAPLNGFFDVTFFSGQAPTITYAGTTIEEENKRIELQSTEGIPLSEGGSQTLYVIIPPTDHYTQNKLSIKVTAYDEESSNSMEGVTIHEFEYDPSEISTGAIARNRMVAIDLHLEKPNTIGLEGLGTEENPYRISSVEDLLNMQRLANEGFVPLGSGMPFASGFYQLQNDIDCGHIDSLFTIGTASNNFTGHFDGNGHTISNIQVQKGFFGYTSEATLTNFIIHNAVVDMTDSPVGGTICARANDCTLDRCRVEGSVTFNNVPNAAAYLGGIVGEATGHSSRPCQIKNCHCGASMTLMSGKAAHSIGGIVGHLLGGTVMNSYTKVLDNEGDATMTIANAYGGGIVGRSDGESGIVNCYFGINDRIESVVGHAADICAAVGESTVIIDCYYQTLVYATGNPRNNNIQGTFQFDIVGGEAQYTCHNQHVSSLLNTKAVALGLLGWESQSTPSIAPELAF